MERLLTTAEKLNAVATRFGAPSAKEAIEAAWEPVLFNQAHDLSSGVMVDKVYDDSMQRYHQSQQMAEDIVRSNLDHLTARADTSGGGVPIAVFNALAWTRSDLAEVDVAFSEPGVRSFALLDDSGKPIPIQMSRMLRNDDGGLRQARIAFIARDVPAMGYAIYRAVPNTPGPQQKAKLTAHNTTTEDAATIENRVLSRFLQPVDRRNDRPPPQGKQLGSTGETRERCRPGT